MAASDIRKNFNLFVDGRGYAGKVSEFNAPKLTLKTQEFRAGGMNTPIDLTMGMEKLTADFTLDSYDADVLALFGVSEGQRVPFTAREVLESFDGQVKAVVHTLRGKITEIDPGTSKPGDPAPLKAALSLTYYKLEHDGRTIHEIDPENMVQIVDGVDQLAAQRQALAI